VKTQKGLLPAAAKTTAAAPVKAHNVGICPQEDGRGTARAVAEV